MLARKHRLRRDEDIKRVLRTGRRVRASLASFSILKRSSSDIARVSVVVGKRVHTSAVVRHRVQRLLREIVGDILRIHPIGYDMVVVADSSAAQVRSKSDVGGLHALILKAIERL